VCDAGRLSELVATRALLRLDFQSVWVYV
jgi:hypothetical protein